MKSVEKKQERSFRNNGENSNVTNYSIQNARALPPTYQLHKPAAEESNLEDVDNTIQQKTIASGAEAPESPEQPSENNNNKDLPAHLKQAIETLSGISMDDIKVNYNSQKPNEIGAHAYAQGANIHLGRGQEKHLPHEAWHVVQQKQGRVKPDMQLKGKDINSDSTLEKEADQMGEKAATFPIQGNPSSPSQLYAPPNSTIQRVQKIGFEMEDAYWRTWHKNYLKNPFRNRFYTDKGDKSGVRPLAKHEIIHNGTGFNLEADGFVENNEVLADMEFVTDPFPLNEGGRENLVDTLDEIGGIYNTLGPMSGRDHQEGNFIEQDEHGLSNSRALFSKGQATAGLNLQATSGLSLSDIPKVFTAISDSNLYQSHNPDAYALIQFGNSGENDPSENRVFDPLKNAPIKAFDLAAPYLEANLENDDLEAFGEGYQIIGFLTAVIGFILAMKYVTVQGGAKTYTPMMHRNDFNTLFKLLSEEEQTVLKDNLDTFINAVLFAVLSNSGDNVDDFDADASQDELMIENFIIGNDEKREFLTNGQFLPNQVGQGDGFTGIKYSVIPPLTIKRWITRWMHGEDPKDLMTEVNFAETASRDVDENVPLSQSLNEFKNLLHPDLANIVDWETTTIDESTNPKTAKLVFDYNKLSTKQKEIINFHGRGTGGLGTATDEENPNLALFENRAMQPVESKDGGGLTDGTKVAFPLAETSILSYFDGMRQLLNDGGD